MKLFLLILSLLMINKNIYCQCTNCGIIIKSELFFDSSKNEFNDWLPPVKILYKDSIAIISSPGTSFKTFNNVSSNKVITERKFYDVHYTFVDFRFNPKNICSSHKNDTLSKSKFKSIAFYEYPAFSKDSFFTRKYIDIDSSINRVGDHFYLNSNIRDGNILSSIKDSIISVSDTTIEGVFYKRTKKMRTVNEPDKHIQSIFIAYFQCDIDNWMLPFISEFDESGKCAFTRIDWLILNKQPWISQRTEFSKRKLTQDEINVFNAWERNAKLYPVNK